MCTEGKTWKRDAETRLDRAMLAFGRLPGVIGIGVGFRETGGRMLDSVALRIIVRQKMALHDVPPGERLPPFFEGVPIDVSEPFGAVPLVSEPLDCGIEMAGAPVTNDTGSLGCFAVLNNRLVLLTAGHVVIEGTGAVPQGVDVGAPSVGCCCCCKTGVIGQTLTGQIDGTIDCAITSLTSDRAPVQLVPGLGSTIGTDGNPTGLNSDLILGSAPGGILDPTSGKTFSVAVGQHVRKVGARTHKTGGKVTNISVPGIPPDPVTGLPASMTGQIVIRANLTNLSVSQDSGAGTTFSMGGDSGAVIVDDNNLVVGLLHRGAIFQNPAPNEGYGGVMTDISQVMNFLNITIAKSATALPATTPASAALPGGVLHGSRSLTEDDRKAQVTLAALKAELGEFTLGRRIIDFAERHHAEIERCVNHSRRFKVAWHRAHGPAFVARWLRGDRALDQPMPESIEGARRSMRCSPRIAPSNKWDLRSSSTTCASSGRPCGKRRSAARRCGSGPTTSGWQAPMSDNNAGTIQGVAIQVSRFFAPIARELANGQFVELFAELGLNFPPGLESDPTFTTAAASTFPDGERPAGPRTGRHRRG